MDAVDLLRWAHILGATVLIGTGAGIAFFMIMAHRTRNAALIAHTASIVVIADWIFTATAVVAQPVSGVLLALEVGWSLTEGWILASVGLYVIIGCCWLPVVWIQKTMCALSRAAAERGAAPPERYFRLFRVWFWLGVPAFTAILALLWLMVARPAI